MQQKITDTSYNTLKVADKGINLQRGNIQKGKILKDTKINGNTYKQKILITFCLSMKAKWEKNTDIKYIKNIIIR